MPNRKRPDEKKVRQITEEQARKIGLRYSQFFQGWTRRPDIDRFLKEIIEVCEKHGYAIGINPKKKPFGGLIAVELRPDTLQAIRDAEIGYSVDAIYDEKVDDMFCLPDEPIFGRQDGIVLVPDEVLENYDNNGNS